MKRAGPLCSGILRAGFIISMAVQNASLPATSQRGHRVRGGAMTMSDEHLSQGPTLTARRLICACAGAKLLGVQMN